MVGRRDLLEPRGDYVLAPDSAARRAVVPGKIASSLTGKEWRGTKPRPSACSRFSVG